MLCTHWLQPGESAPSERDGTGTSQLLLHFQSQNHPTDAESGKGVNEKAKRRTTLRNPSVEREETSAAIALLEASLPLINLITTGARHSARLSSHVFTPVVKRISMPQRFSPCKEQQGIQGKNNLKFKYLTQKTPRKHRNTKKLIY